MKDQLIACVPGFPEVYRPEVSEQIITAIRAMEGVLVLDPCFDAGHHCTTLTIVGHPSAVQEAVFQSIQTALRLIDLNPQTDRHPHTRAPHAASFIPLKNITMEEGVEISRQLGERAARELSLAVYFYDETELISEYDHPAAIANQYDPPFMMDPKMDPDRKPDFEPLKPGPAGALITGAREPVIPLEVVLNTADVHVAQEVAQSLQSSSGLRHVHAVSVSSDDQAVVSILLTNYRKTPLRQVIDFVRREAGARGAGIEHTRLKGLVPHQTLLDALGLDLQLKDFSEDQILEERLAQACLQQTRSHEQLTQPSLLDRLASSASTPAGGSAAAYTAAAAAAVVVKIARLTLARKQYQDVHPQMDAAIERAESWRAELARYVELDAQAYNEIIRAKRLPRAEPAQAAARSAAIEKAVFGAAAAPLECAWISEHVIKEALNMAAVANISMIADAFSAAALANAAITIFANNVSVNLAAYREREDAAQMIRDAMEIQTRAEQYLHQVQTLLISRREG